jgi:hypothetical protein
MLMLLGVAAAATMMVGAAGIASGANTVKCGGTYQPACAPPNIIPIVITTTCHKEGTTIHIPKFTVTAIAGIKTITISVKGRKKPVKTYKNLNSAQKKTIGGLTVSTAGLKPGAHTITIKVTDTRGKTFSRTLHIAICTPKPPPFTG